MRMVAIVAVAVVVTACGGSDTLGVEEYFDAAGRLSADYQEERDELTVSYLGDLDAEITVLQRGVDESDAAAVEALSDEAFELTKAETAKLFASIGDALVRFGDGLGDLDPPVDVEPLHAELVRSVQLVAAGIPGLLDAVAEAESFDTLDSAIAGSVFNDAQPRLEGACRRLEDDASARGVPTDLSCGP
jgi:hypothetical protein